MKWIDILATEWTIAQAVSWKQDFWFKLPTICLRSYFDRQLPEKFTQITLLGMSYVYLSVKYRQKCSSVSIENASYMASYVPSYVQLLSCNSLWPVKDFYPSIIHHTHVIWFQ